MFDPFTAKGDHEIQFTNGETRTIDVKLVAVTTHGKVLWIEGVDDAVYVIDNIISIRKL